MNLRFINIVVIVMVIMVRVSSIHAEEINTDSNDIELMNIIVNEYIDDIRSEQFNVIVEKDRGIIDNNNYNWRSSRVVRSKATFVTTTTGEGISDIGIYPIITKSNVGSNDTILVTYLYLIMTRTADSFDISTRLVLDKNINHT